MAQTHVHSANARAIPTSIKVTVPGFEARPSNPCRCRFRAQDIQRDSLPRPRRRPCRALRKLFLHGRHSLSQPITSPCSLSASPIRHHTVPYPSTSTPTAKTCSSPPYVSSSLMPRPDSFNARVRGPSHIDFKTATTGIAAKARLAILSPPSMILARRRRLIRRCSRSSIFSRVISPSGESTHTCAEFFFPSEAHVSSLERFPYRTRTCVRLLVSYSRHTNFCSLSARSTGCIRTWLCQGSTTMACGGSWMSFVCTSLPWDR
ncbi:hypothetical protein BDZ89DRAFT_551951 [Hymenopellis radicata]|nr:hypothetical protein BDZ89DRAFT_551951 [Hymenopellis radicata]